VKAVILVIEDNLEVLENISEILALADFRVLIATNGRDGVELAIKERPDIILSDILMPLVDGYTVLRKLRENSVTQNIPVIYVSALEERKPAGVEMEMEANGYVKKPFTQEALLKAIRANLKNQRV